MKFHTPPKNQGQTVEVSYAGVAAGIIMRVHDRSDRSTSYYLARWTNKLDRWWDAVGPWNAEPPTKFGRRLSEKEVARLDPDEDEDEGEGLGAVVPRNYAIDNMDGNELTAGLTEHKCGPSCTRNRRPHG